MESPLPKRLVSLDAFRGATIALMILVNNPGSWSYVLPPLEHAEWHGCTPTDLVFPFFLFIMGVAMAFSFARRLASAGSLKPLYLKIIKRTVILILLGFVLRIYLSWNFTTMRYPGVLQRIGICYFFASMIVLRTRLRGQIFWILALLLGYWGLMTLVPFPGKGPDAWAFGHNFAQYVDNLVLKGHMWKPDFDPEGIVSTIPAVATVLLGYLTGQWLRTRRQPYEKTVGLFVAGDVLIVLALFWTYWMPLNKQLWTSSYVLYTGGIALNALAVSYWLIDIHHVRRGVRPFVVYGSNAILAFFGSTFMAKTFYKVTFRLGDGSRTSITGYLFGHILRPLFGNWLGSLVHALLYILIWWAVLEWMYRRRIFIKI